MSRAAAIADVAIVLAVLFLFIALPGLARPVIGPAVARAWYLWAVAAGVASLVTVALRLGRRGETPAAIGLGPAPAGRVVRATLAALPLCYLAGIAAALLAGALSPAGIEGMTRQKSDFLRVVAVIPPGLVLPLSLFVGLYEEIVFRGFLLARLRVVAGGDVVAPVCLTTALFGALHFPQGLVGVAQTAAVGLVLAIVVARTGTVWPAILAHATIDTVSLTLASRLIDHLPAG
jgi:membrane protease YdiL (CAAX protease family)